ncbi:MAG: tRNA/rRNA methyltransferase SpoU [Oscillospiraceae bacterium]|jgi:TrmH family RNA methyltransferase|nr:tRNA/rRNA methyltransferase SpoU [Oscillospiraceae bacterium]
MEYIKSRENSHVKEYVKLCGSKKERAHAGVFAIEGIKICLEAFCEGIEIEKVFVTKDCYEKYYDKLEEISRRCKDFFIISQELESKMSDTKTPQGIFCVCKKLDKHINVDTIYNKRSFVMLCSIQDPGNLGTIIRTADALGFDGVILTQDCCDIYNPKVVRSTMGSLLRMDMLVVEDAVRFINNIGADVDTMAAVIDEDAQSVNDVSQNSQRPFIICIGNEGNGLDKDLVKACKKKVTIRMKGKAESLNAAVAASILMWELSKDQ